MSEKVLDNTTLAAEQNAGTSAKFGEWRPIEAAPKNNMQILIAYKDREGTTKLCCARWKGDRWLVATTNGYKLECWVSDATHWMPLPEPPTSAASSSATKIQEG